MTPALRPVLSGVLIGLLVGAGTAPLLPWQVAPLLGWDAAGIVFLVWVWHGIASLDGRGTARVAATEDPNNTIADLVIITAGLACLGAVGLVLAKAANSSGTEKALLIVVAIASVAISWACIHTVFTLRYARLYYQGPDGGIDFNSEEEPDYLDFAYLAFTIGLTFQVSDTNIGSKPIRRMALRHALVSFLFGAVIVSLTINVVASLLR